MFNQEGNVQLIIGEIAFSECKFADGKGPDDFDICIEVTHAEDPTQHDWARLEWSENYGKGVVVSHLMQRDLALQTLHKIGFEGDDLSTLEEQLPAGTIVPGRVTSKEKDGVTYYHVFLGGGGGNAPSEDKRLSMAELKRRLMKSGGGASNPSDVFKPAPKAAASSGKHPFV